jgi:hypothetical protein
MVTYVLICALFNHLLLAAKILALGAKNACQIFFFLMHFLILIL